MPTKTGNPQRELVRDILMDALSRPDDISLDGLVDEIMEAATSGIKNYAIGYMASSIQRRDNIPLSEATAKAESAIMEAALI